MAAYCVCIHAVQYSGYTVDNIERILVLGRNRWNGVERFVTIIIILTKNKREERLRQILIKQTKTNILEYCNIRRVYI